MTLDRKTTYGPGLVGVSENKIRYHPVRIGGLQGLERDVLPHRLHQRAGDPIQDSVVATALPDIIGDDGGHWENHRIWNRAITPQHIVDQEPVHATIAIRQGVDIDETESRHRTAHDWRLALRSVQEGAQPIQHRGAGPVRANSRTRNSKCGTSWRRWNCRWAAGTGAGRIASR